LHKGWHDRTSKQKKKKLTMEQRIKQQHGDARVRQLKEKNKKWKQKLFGALDLPEEIQGDVPKLTMVGRSDLLVENHGNVLQYTCEVIRLYTTKGILKIDGSALELLELGTERAYVKGLIRGIGYEE